MEEGFDYICDTFFVVRLSGLRIAGDAISPVKHLYLTAPSGDREKDLSKLRRIVAKVGEKRFCCDGISVKLSMK